MLNMIVGVVVENFQRCRERLEDEETQRKRRKLLEKTKNKNQEGEKLATCHEGHCTLLAFLRLCIRSVGS